MKLVQQLFLWDRTRNKGYGHSDSAHLCPMSYPFLLVLFLPLRNLLLNNARHVAYPQGRRWGSSYNDIKAITLPQLLNPIFPTALQKPPETIPFHVYPMSLFFYMSWFTHFSSFGVFWIRSYTRIFSLSSSPSLSSLLTSNLDRMWWISRADRYCRGDAVKVWGSAHVNLSDTLKWLITGRINCNQKCGAIVARVKCTLL